MKSHGCFLLALVFAAACGTQPLAHRSAPLMERWVLFSPDALHLIRNAAGRSDIAGQQCALCIARNPGDYDTCRVICVQRVEDEDAS